MKIAIIGAGNMGGAIARGLILGLTIDTKDIYVSNPSQPQLDKLSKGALSIRFISKFALNIFNVWRQ